MLEFQCLPLEWIMYREMGWKGEKWLADRQWPVVDIRLQNEIFLEKEFRLHTKKIFLLIVLHGIVGIFKGTEYTGGRDKLEGRSFNLFARKSCIKLLALCFVLFCNMRFSSYFTSAVVRMVRHEWGSAVWCTKHGKMTNTTLIFIS